MIKSCGCDEKHLQFELETKIILQVRNFDGIFDYLLTGLHKFVSRDAFRLIRIKGKVQFLQEITIKIVIKTITEFLSKYFFNIHLNCKSLNLTREIIKIAHDFIENVFSFNFMFSFR